MLNSNRKRIYLYIKNNPGIYFNALAKQLNIRFNVLEWHLNMLLKFKFIRKEYVNGIGIYFNRDLKFETAKIFHFISKEKIKKIIFYLKIHNTGTTKTKLRKDLQMHHSTIKKYLEELEEYNLITKEHKDNKYYFFLKDDIFHCISSKVSKAKSGKEVI